MVRIVNPELKILEINEPIEVTISICIKKGKNSKVINIYEDKANENYWLQSEPNFISVLRVSPLSETKIELIDNGDCGCTQKLTFTIKTNGVLSPREALDEAINLLKHYYDNIIFN